MSTEIGHQANKTMIIPGKRSQLSPSKLCCLNATFYHSGSNSHPEIGREFEVRIKRIETVTVIGESNKEENRTSS